MLLRLWATPPKPVNRFLYIFGVNRTDPEIVRRQLLDYNLISEVGFSKTGSWKYKNWRPEKCLMKRKYNFLEWFPSFLPGLRKVDVSPGKGQFYSSWNYHQNRLTGLGVNVGKDKLTSILPFEKYLDTELARTILLRISPIQNLSTRELWRISFPI